MIKIVKYNEISPEEVLKRTTPQAQVSRSVAEIIDTVRKLGDAALFDYACRFDGVSLDSLSVEKDEIETALNEVEAEFLEVLKLAASNIYDFHSKQVSSGFKIEGNGTVRGQRVIALDSVGLYIPGGTAAYPSTVLMNAIPAKIAGVKRLVMMTPPNKEGKINPGILAAAGVAGIDCIYKIGGAQAIAALAYGTSTIEPVDKIVGPGNAYVSEAKRQVFGHVAIDMIAGPSEILCIADETANPRFVAADLLSQAEHDKMASAVLVTNSIKLAQDVQMQIEEQVKMLEREEIARASIGTNGKIIVCESLNEAINIANKIAPEHLELCIDNPFDYLDQIKHAGSVFLGKYCPEALGDYLSGTNHTLPTSGTARFSSPLSVEDFVKRSQFTYYTAQALSEVSKAIDTFATKEGLTGHAKSVLIRFEDENTGGENTADKNNVESTADENKDENTADKNKDEENET